MSTATLTKEKLLIQVDALRDVARRGRRVTETLELESDRRRIKAHCDGIEELAVRIEKQAGDAKTFLIGAATTQKSNW